jgi:5-hydroxyisourate hydrolase
MARLTTHILDTSQGRPAANVRIQLFRLLADGDRLLLADLHSNHDGRTDEPMLSGDAITPGSYELLFHMGDYFSLHYVGLADPAFLDQVPIRFAIAEAGGHYHVPLLASPWAYSTYRGS